MVGTGAIPLTILGIAGLLAYLAINLDQEHWGLKYLNLGISYLTIGLTAYVTMSYAEEEMPGTAVAGMASAYGTYFTYILFFVFGYMVFHVIYLVFKDMVKL